MRMLLFMYTPTSKKHHTYCISSVKRLSQSICNKNPNKGTSTLVKCPKIMLDLSLMCFHVLVISTISPSFGIGCREERFDFHQGVVHLLGLLRKSTLHRLINFLSQTQNVLLQCRLESFFRSRTSSKLCFVSACNCCTTFSNFCILCSCCWNFCSVGPDTSRLTSLVLGNRMPVYDAQGSF